MTGKPPAQSQNLNDTHDTWHSWPHVFEYMSTPESFLRFFIHFIGENEWLYIRLVWCCMVKKSSRVSKTWEFFLCRFFHSRSHWFSCDRQTPGSAFLCLFATLFLTFWCISSQHRQRNTLTQSGEYTEECRELHVSMAILYLWDVAFLGANLGGQLFLG